MALRIRRSAMFQFEGKMDRPIITTYDHLLALRDIAFCTNTKILIRARCKLGGDLCESEFIEIMTHPIKNLHKTVAYLKFTQEEVYNLIFDIKSNGEDYKTPTCPCGTEIPDHNSKRVKCDVIQKILEFMPRFVQGESTNDLHYRTVYQINKSLPMRELKLDE